MNKEDKSVKSESVGFIPLKESAGECDNCKKRDALWRGGNQNLCASCAAEFLVRTMITPNREES